MLSKNFIDRSLISGIIKPRNPFTHKGDYGHACLITGSIGLMGAAVLAVKASLRAGTGKVTAFAPFVGYNILQISAPEAMVKLAGEDFIMNVDGLEKYDSLSIGPGIGLYESHINLLKEVFSQYKKSIIVDADALNILSRDAELIKLLPANSILTPHFIEFDRLFGKHDSEKDRQQTAIKISEQHNIYIVLKGHHTIITTPEGKHFFNSTGNAGMATGGSGDVLTGIFTGLLAQGYSPLNTCLIGVYLHGLAGDIAAEKISEPALIAGDIVENLGYAFKQLLDKG